MKNYLQQEKLLATLPHTRYVYKRCERLGKGSEGVCGESLQLVNDGYADYGCWPVATELAACHSLVASDQVANDYAALLLLLLRWL